MMHDTSHKDEVALSALQAHGLVIVENGEALQIGPDATVRFGQ
jgi:hypothetical protein